MQFGIVSGSAGQGDILLNVNTFLNVKSISLGNILGIVVENGTFSSVQIPCSNQHFMLGHAIWASAEGAMRMNFES